MQRPPMANFWVHGGLLLFDNRKMSKSLGNFEPLSEVVRRYDPQAIRWLFLQTGYRKVMNFTEDSIAAAQSGLAHIKTAYKRAAEHPETPPRDAAFDAKMEAALDDDMNTAAALAVLYDYAAKPAPSFERLRYWLTIVGIIPDATWLEEPRRKFDEDFVGRLEAALQLHGDLEGSLQPRRSNESWRCAHRRAPQKIGRSPTVYAMHWKRAALRCRIRKEDDVDRRLKLDFDDLVYGIHAVEEALIAGEPLRSIAVAADRTKDARIRGLLAQAKERNVRVRFEQRGFFDRLPFKAHQGIVAIAPPFEYVTFEEILARHRDGTARLIVILDHLTDPHNVGAIVRTAEAAGADGLASARTPFGGYQCNGA